MKKRLAIILALVLALSMVLVACDKSGNEDQPKTGGDDGEMLIEVVAKGFQHQFWKAVEQGALDAGKELGVKVHFVGPDTEENVEQQVGFMQDAISAKPAAICLAALNTESMKQSLEETKAQNIPVIGFDSGVPGAPEGSIAANASTDNNAAGALAAEELYKLVKDEIDGADKAVRIGVVSQETNSESIIGRTVGFIDKMKELVGADKVAVVGNQFYAKDGGDEATAKVILDVGVPAKIENAEADATAVALLDKADLIAIYGSNEFSANAIVRAGESAGDKIGNRAEDPTKVWAVGFDAGKVLKDAVRDGRLVGGITQDPVQIGYKAVELAVKAAKGEAVEDVDTGARWYTADNMDDAEIAPLLYD